MLLEFKTENYKSFSEETIFSMIPAPKQKGLDYSVLSEKLKSKTIKSLSSSVIYGPNAAGKTNIIGALDTFRAIVLRGNIRNSEEKSSPNTASYNLELIPNNKHKDEPVSFSISFIENGLKVDYSVVMNLGDFLNDDSQRNIVREELYINDEIVFVRDDKLSFGNFKNIKSYVSVKSTDKNVFEIAENSLNNEELFLTNGFKLIISQNLVKEITDWFKDKLMVIYRADSLQIIRRFIDPQKKTVYVEQTTNKAAKEFGISSNDLGYVVSEDETEAKLCSLFKDLETGEASVLAADIFESYGTVRFVNIFPLVIRAILTGGTLIVDEFDASIHPMALMSIINVFHNDDINKKGAQLVFNTHNPVFLNSNLFRRDEIKFVERDDETGFSTLYSLSDFGTTGENGVRKHEDYMKNYFVSRYGGIKDVDFSSIFEELLENGSEV
ncbi:MAG: ATP-binding protein [Clostridia bacterium]